ncbi:hypothetical protein J5A54_09780 [Prevotella melaninogenica]|uniref:hypothetical protein n=1 Tax=Prevotella melaninogenica TaxID=28132 RepID=UPI001BA5A331|nr:hypothetical protein [Prevotella melaninogenica]QUB64703.1 hypothetical protein J5A54_09780 [Prevotella melaninogenica]
MKQNRKKNNQGKEVKIRVSEEGADWGYTIICKVEKRKSNLIHPSIINQLSKFDNPDILGVEDLWMVEEMSENEKKQWIAETHKILINSKIDNPSIFKTLDKSLVLCYDKKLRLCRRVKLYFEYNKNQFSEIFYLDSSLDSEDNPIVINEKILE